MAPALSAPVEARLREFAALVARWSAKINLVSRADIAHLWARHVEDSLALLPHIPPNTSHAIDIGSGAGFPGLVLAIASNIPFTLIESDKRKAAFLLDAARQLNAPAIVKCQRIETVQNLTAPLVTARALASLDKLLGLAAPLLAPGGICLFPKGRNLETELAPAKALWHMEVERLHTPLDGQSCILKVSHLRHVGQSG